MLCYIFIPSHKLDACVIIAHKDGKKFQLYSHSFTPFVSCVIHSWFDVDDDDESGADQVRIGLAYDCCFFFIRQSNDIIGRWGRGRKFTCFWALNSIKCCCVMWKSSSECMREIKFISIILEALFSPFRGLWLKLECIERKKVAKFCYGIPVVLVSC